MKLKLFTEDGKVVQDVYVIVERIKGTLVNSIRINEIKNGICLGVRITYNVDDSLIKFCTHNNILLIDLTK